MVELKSLLIKVLLLSLLALNLESNQRVIALSPLINELIFALNEGERVVGNTTFCNYPKESIDIPKVGGFFSVSLEKVLELEPDLVILQKNNSKLAKKLNTLSIETLMIQIESIESIKRAILKIGKIFEKERRALEIVSEIEIALNSLKGIISNQDILIVFGENLSLSREIFVSGRDLYFDEIIRVSGNQNALKNALSNQPTLSLEGIISLNPDIVILIAPDTEFSKNTLIKPWLKLPIKASKEQNIYVANQSYSAIASDRLVLFLRDFREYLKNSK